MGKIWTGLMLAALLCAAVSGKTAVSAQRALESGEAAVSLLLRMAGVMTLWSGMMEILGHTGDLNRLGKALRRLLRPLLPDLKDDACWDLMGMNLAANMLGLGNAATPAGIEASRHLAAQGEAGMKGLILLLVLNHSCLEILPSTVITLRAAAGSVHPGSIWWPTLLASGAATLTALVLIAWRGRCMRRAH